MRKVPDKKVIKKKKDGPLLASSAALMMPLRLATVRNPGLSKREPWGVLGSLTENLGKWLGSLRANLGEWLGSLREP